MATPTMKLVMTILGFAVSSAFIVFVCMRLFCARLRRRRRRLMFTPDMEFIPHAIERSLHGMDTTLVMTFPTMKYSQNSFSSRGDATCTVCLAEYEDKEVLRVLPKCGHAFHIGCIDAWLQLNATCPICRISLRSSPELGVSHTRMHIEGLHWFMPGMSSAHSLHPESCSPIFYPVLDSAVSSQSHQQHMLCPNTLEAPVLNPAEGHVWNETSNMGITSTSTVNGIDSSYGSESGGRFGELEMLAGNELVREKNYMAEERKGDGSVLYQCASSGASGTVTIDIISQPSDADIST